MAHPVTCRDIVEYVGGVALTGSGSEVAPVLFVRRCYPHAHNWPQIYQIQVGQFFMGVMVSMVVLSHTPLSVAIETIRGWCAPVASFGTVSLVRTFGSRYTRFEWDNSSWELWYQW